MGMSAEVPLQPLLRGLRGLSPSYPACSSHDGSPARLRVANLARPALPDLQRTRSAAGSLALGCNVHHANVEPFFRSTFPTTGPKQVGFIVLVAVGVKRQAPAIGLP